MAVTVQELGYLPFRSLQGEAFTWRVFKHKKTSRSSFDIISLKAKPYNSYKFYEVLLDEKEELGSEVFEQNGTDL